MRIHGNSFTSINTISKDFIRFSENEGYSNSVVCLTLSWRYCGLVYDKKRKYY